MEASLHVFERVVVKQADVLKLFSGCNAQKKPRPGQNKWTLKHCDEQIVGGFTDIFQSSLDRQLWWNIDSEI